MSRKWLDIGFIGHKWKEKEYEKGKPVLYTLVLHLAQQHLAQQTTLRLHLSVKVN